MKTRNRRILSLFVIGLAAFASAQAGNLEPPPGPVSPTPPPDTCFDNVGRYAVCGDGTVKDNLTGLIWLEDANCFGAQFWASASISAEQLADGQCGLTDRSSPGDWRLPTIEEWQAILDQAITNGCSNPYVPDLLGTGCCGTGTCVFSGVQSNVYWSSTTNVTDPGLAWCSGLSGGNVGNDDKSNSRYVWPIRGGP